LFSHLLSAYPINLTFIFFFLRFERYTQHPLAMHCCCGCLFKILRRRYRRPEKQAKPMPATPANTPRPHSPPPNTAQPSSPVEPRPAPRVNKPLPEPPRIGHFSATVRPRDIAKLPRNVDFVDGGDARNSLHTFRPDWGSQVSDQVGSDDEEPMYEFVHGEPGKVTWPLRRVRIEKTPLKTEPVDAGYQADEENEAEVEAETVRDITSSDVEGGTSRHNPFSDLGDNRLGDITSNDIEDTSDAQLERERARQKKKKERVERIRQFLQDHRLQLQPQRYQHDSPMDPSSPTQPESAQAPKKLRVRKVDVSSDTDTEASQPRFKVRMRTVEELGNESMRRLPKRRGPVFLTFADENAAQVWDERVKESASREHTVRSHISM